MDVSTSEVVGLLLNSSGMCLWPVSGPSDTHQGSRRVEMMAWGTLSVTLHRSSLPLLCSPAALVPASRFAYTVV
jgi:hypothetical protein